MQGLLSSLPSVSIFALRGMREVVGAIRFLWADLVPGSVGREPSALASWTIIEVVGIKSSF